MSETATPYADIHPIAGIYPDDIGNGRYSPESLHPFSDSITKILLSNTSDKISDLITFSQTSDMARLALFQNEHSNEIIRVINEEKRWGNFLETVAVPFFENIGNRKIYVDTPTSDSSYVVSPLELTTLSQLCARELLQYQYVHSEDQQQGTVIVAFLTNQITTDHLPFIVSQDTKHLPDIIKHELQQSVIEYPHSEFTQTAETLINALEKRDSIHDNLHTIQVQMRRTRHTGHGDRSLALAQSQDIVNQKHIHTGTSHLRTQIFPDQDIQHVNIFLHQYGTRILDAIASEESPESIATLVESSGVPYAMDITNKMLTVGVGLLAYEKYAQKDKKIAKKVLQQIKKIIPNLETSYYEKKPFPQQIPDYDSSVNMDPQFPHYDFIDGLVSSEGVAYQEEMSLREQAAEGILRISTDTIKHIQDKENKPQSLSATHLRWFIMAQVISAGLAGLYPDTSTQMRVVATLLITGGGLAATTPLGSSSLHTLEGLTHTYKNTAHNVLKRYTNEKIKKKIRNIIGTTLIVLGIAIGGDFTESNPPEMTSSSRPTEHSVPNIIALPQLIENVGVQHGLNPGMFGNFEHTPSSLHESPKFIIYGDKDVHGSLFWVKGIGSIEHAITNNTIIDSSIAEHTSRNPIQTIITANTITDFRQIIEDSSKNNHLVRLNLPLRLNSSNSTQHIYMEIPAHYRVSGVIALNGNTENTTGSWSPVTGVNIQTNAGVIAVIYELDSNSREKGMLTEPIEELGGELWSSADINQQITNNPYLYSIIQQLQESDLPFVEEMNIASEQLDTIMDYGFGDTTNYSALGETQKVIATFVKAGGVGICNQFAVTLSTSYGLSHPPNKGKPVYVLIGNVTRFDEFPYTLGGFSVRNHAISADQNDTGEISLYDGTLPSGPEDTTQIPQTTSNEDALSHLESLLSVDASKEQSTERLYVGDADNSPPSSYPVSTEALPVLMATASATAGLGYYAYQKRRRQQKERSQESKTIEENIVEFGAKFVPRASETVIWFLRSLEVRKNYPNAKSFIASQSRKFLPTLLDDEMKPHYSGYDFVSRRIHDQAKKLTTLLRGETIDREHLEYLTTYQFQEIPGVRTLLPTRDEIAKIIKQSNQSPKLAIQLIQHTLTVFETIHLDGYKTEYDYQLAQSARSVLWWTLQQL